MIIYPCRHRTIVKQPNGCIAVINSKGEMAHRSAAPLQYYEGVYWGVQRLAYHLNVKPIPRRLKDRRVGQITTTCSNGWCINPKHLSIRKNSGRSTKEPDVLRISSKRFRIHFTQDKSS